MQFNPETWVCFLLFLSLVFHDTGDESPIIAIIPFLSSIPFVVSSVATVFLIPDLVLSSSIPSSVPQRHPTPVPASHYFNPPQGRWLVSYRTTFDDETLYSLAIRCPLNGTAKLVTRKYINWLAPDEFVGAPTTEEGDAAIESPIHDTPMALGLIGFPGLELGAQVEGLHGRRLCGYTDGHRRRRLCKLVLGLVQRPPAALSPPVKPQRAPIPRTIQATTNERRSTTSTKRGWRQVARVFLC